MDRGVWKATVNEFARVGHNLVTKPPPPYQKGFPHCSVSKESACNAGDLGLISGLGRSLGEGNGTPLQYSCLDNPMDGGAWQAIVHGVIKSQT